MKYIYAILLLALGQLTFAQGILKGTIKDANTKKPMEGVTVMIIGTYSGAYTDADGIYEIQDIQPGDYTIRFSMLNYADKEYTGISIPAGEKVLDIEMGEAIETMGEVVIVGEKNLIDLEGGKSQTKVSEEQISQMNVTGIQGIVAQQVGVQQTPDGVQIRGGRVYETQYVVEGINAQDPLAGTGFGVDVNASAVSSVDVITGGSDAEFGSGSSGVIVTRIKEGGNKWTVAGNYYRDNLGFAKNQGVSWNTDQGSVSVGGPIIKDKLNIFVNASAIVADNYFRIQANQLHSSMFPKNDSMWAPRQENQWTNTVKLTYKISPSFKLSVTNQHSLNINQNNRSLQVVGNNNVMQPGLQYNFALQPDNANTYTHSSNLTAATIKGLLSERWTMEASVGRLFTQLRTDANGRPFRTQTVDQIYDPSSIVTDPVTIFNPDDSVSYVYPGPGLVNNNGIATTWHDHYAEEYTIKSKFTYQTKSKVHYWSFGQEHIFQQYQWIDVTRPWVGAPIQVNDTFSTPSSSLGSSSDYWKASPRNGGIFFQDEIRYKGIIAVLGARINYWAPSKYVDDAVENEKTPVLDQIRKDYKEQTFGLAGVRWKARILPRLRVSFPITSNNVLYFNYSHAMRLPHPRFVYAGLDPVYQDRSFLANLGNPNLNPEVTVSYELGVKSQLTKDLAFTATAFYNDKFDYIVSRKIVVKDQTGRFVEKTFFINQDYARIQGIEVAFTRRLGKTVLGTLSGAYQQAKGKSNSAAESALQIQQQGFVNTTKEQFLAWDRPFDIKGMLIYKADTNSHIGRMKLKGWRAMLSATYKSGLRYTPYRQVGASDSGRPLYELIDDQPFSKIGSPWIWADVRVSRDFSLGKNRFLSISARMDNFINYKSAAIINGVTGKAYEYGDPLPQNFRDPAYPDPQDSGVPPTNPARYLQPAHFMLGVEFSY
ncbi:MAG: TonB-dependent receptor [Bacteroidia bacterium]